MHTIPRIPLISLTSRIAALDDADQKKKKKMLRWMEHKLWIRVGVVMTVQKNSKQQTNGKRKCFITHQLIAIENWVRSIMIIIVLPFLFYIFSVRCDFCSSSPSVRRQNCAIRVNTKKKKKNMENWIHQVIMTHSRAAVGKKSAHFFVCLQQFPAMFNESTASTKTIVNKFAHVIWNSHNFWTCNWCLSTLLLLHTHLLLGFFHIYLYSAV